MKRTIRIIICLFALAFFTTSCYTTNNCPAYGHYSQVVTVNE